ncbi:MAG: DUF2750 domain-containing protein [Colwellia sp.]|nr:DUF2750 domain-containing protein [Colwellia sp.]
MSDTNSTLSAFMAETKTEQSFWALQDKTSEDWVVLDSVNFEQTEVMPIWSTESLAVKHCCDEWQDYVPAIITLAEWLEFWIEDLKEDNIVIGINWPVEGDCVEVELSEFSQALAEIETL